MTLRAGWRRGWVAALLLAACAGSPPARPPIEPEPDPGPAPPSTADLLPAEIATVGWDAFTASPIVLLREQTTGQIVPIWIGVAEARAIAAGLHGMASPRPLTHDLMSDLLASLGGVLEAVLIHDLREGTYYGLLEVGVEGREEPLYVDTRPSDGLALAVRTGAAIRVHRSLLEDSPDFRFEAPDADEQIVRSLGLTVVALSEEIRRELDLPDRPGVVVLRVEGAARAAGLRRGDLIVALGDQPVSAPFELLEALVATPAGEAVRIRFWRDGEESEVEVEQGSEPSGPDQRKVEVA